MWRTISAVGVSREERRRRVNTGCCWRSSREKTSKSTGSVTSTGRYGYGSIGGGRGKGTSIRRYWHHIRVLIAEEICYKLWPAEGCYPKCKSKAKSSTWGFALRYGALVASFRDVYEAACLGRGLVNHLPASTLPFCRHRVAAQILAGRAQWDARASAAHL